MTRTLGDTWTPEAVALLTDCRTRGLSGTQTAPEFAKRGIAITRNAVIGKARRLKLKARPSPLKRKPKPLSVPIAEHKLKARGLVRSPDGCRWIEGDDFAKTIRAGADPYCGAPRSAGSSWCPLHKAIVYVRVKRTEERTEAAVQGRAQKIGRAAA